MQYRKDYSGFKSYGQSKLANIMFTYELARRLDGARVTAHALHPGFVATGFGQNNKPSIMRLGMTLMQKIMAISPERGAQTQIYLASAPGLDGLTGKYWDNRQSVQSSTASRIEADQKKLWTMTEQLLGAD